MARVHEIVRAEIPAIEADAVAQGEAEAESDAAIDLPVAALEADEPDEPEGAVPAPATAALVSPAPAITAAATATIEPAELALLMSQIEVRPLDNGRIAIELPRPAAAALGGLLRALAAAVEGTPAVH
jgi:hypothetical protein